MPVLVLADLDDRIARVPDVMMSGSAQRCHIWRFELPHSRSNPGIWADRGSEAALLFGVPQHRIPETPTRSRIRNSSGQPCEAFEVVIDWAISLLADGSTALVGPAYASDKRLRRTNVGNPLEGIGRIGKAFVAPLLGYEPLNCRRIRLASPKALHLMTQTPVDFMNCPR